MKRTILEQLFPTGSELNITLPIGELTRRIQSHATAKYVEHGYDHPHLFTKTFHVLIGLSINTLKNTGSASPQFLYLCKEILFLSYLNDRFIKDLYTHYTKKPFSFPQAQLIKPEHMEFDGVFFGIEDRKSIEYLYCWTVYAAFHLWTPRRGLFGEKKSLFLESCRSSQIMSACL